MFKHNQYTWHGVFQTCPYPYSWFTKIFLNVVLLTVSIQFSWVGSYYRVCGYSSVVYFEVLVLSFDNHIWVNGFSLRLMTNIVLIALKLIAIWPRPVLQGLGKAFGWFKYVTNSHAARISRENIQLCYPQLSQKEKTQLLRASLSHTAQTLSLIHIWRCRRRG